MTKISKLEHLDIIGFFLFPPIPLIFSGASFPPLRATLTHFSVSSYERVLYFPTFIPILVWSNLKWNQNAPGPLESLCVDSAAYAFFYPKRKLSVHALLSIPPSLKLTFFENGTHFFYSMLTFGLSYFHQDAALSPLDCLPPHNFMICTNGYVPFLFGERSSGVFANCSICGAEVILLYSACPVCSSFFVEAAPFCELCVGLGSTIKISTSLSFFSSYTFALFLLCFPFLQSSFFLHSLAYLAGNVFLLFFLLYYFPSFFPPILSGYNGSPVTHFSQEMAPPMSWPG